MRVPPILHQLPWVLLLFLVTLLGLFGALDAIAGFGQAVPGDDPRTSQLVISADLEARAAARNLFILGVVLAAIILIPYRRGERWAWWVMWSLPLWALAVSGSFLVIELPPDYPRPAGADSGWIWFALTAGALVLDRKRFDVPARTRSVAAGAAA